jgi:hypothetical protein
MIGVALPVDDRKAWNQEMPPLSLQTIRARRHAELQRHDQDVEVRNPRHDGDMGTTTQVRWIRFASTNEGARGNCAATAPGRFAVSVIEVEKRIEPQQERLQLPHGATKEGKHFHASGTCLIVMPLSCSPHS